MQNKNAVDFLAKFPHTVIRYFDEGKKGPAKSPAIYNPKDVPPTYGAYFSVNGFKNNSKEKKDIINANALHLDLDRIDGKKLTKEDVLATFYDAGAVPSILVETKNGFHGYWLLDTPFQITDANRTATIEAVEGMNYTIAKRIGADPSTSDVSRVLRIPWSMHRKDPQDQFEIRIVHETDTRYSTQELRSIFPPTPRAQKKSNIRIQDAIGAKVGDRHKHLRDLAMSILARGDTPETAIAILVGINATFEQPKDLSEIEMLVRTAIDKVGDKTTKQVRPQHVAPEEDKEIDFLCKVVKDNKIPINCFENVLRALRATMSARYDEFKEQITIQQSHGAGWEVYRDNHINLLQSRLAITFPFLVTAKRSDIENALVALAYESAYDSAKDYVNALVWDRVSRIDNWLTTAMHVEDSLYHRKIGSNWLKGMVSRMMYPGCQFDHALILQGEQGLGKSSALIAIAGENNYVEVTKKLEPKDFAEKIRGKIVIDFSEGAVFYKSDQAEIKSQITNRVDTYRIPYERVTTDHKRRCVFALTSNPTEILKDDTGNRRWWPVMVKEVINVKWIQDNRDQMLAEARHRVVTAKETIWEVPKHMLQDQHDSLRVHEANEDAYIEWYESLTTDVKNGGVSVRDAYHGVFGMNSKYGEGVYAKDIQRATEMSIARIFKGPLKLVKDVKSKTSLWIPSNPLQGLPLTVEEPEEVEGVYYRKHPMTPAQLTRNQTALDAFDAL